MKILIVDDNPTNVIIIREILKKEDYKNFITASSAKEMLKILGIASGNDTARPRHSDVDLILLDMMMPEMDGIEACRVVQQYEHLRDIPIIMVTAVGDSKNWLKRLMQEPAIMLRNR